MILLILKIPRSDTLFTLGKHLKNEFNTLINKPLEIGDMVDTPYGPGVVIEANNQSPQSLCQRCTISVSGTDYKIKQIGMRSIGKCN